MYESQTRKQEQLCCCHHFRPFLELGGFCKSNLKRYGAAGTQLCVPALKACTRKDIKCQQAWFSPSSFEMLGGSGGGGGGNDDDY